MKTIIAGSRAFKKMSILDAALENSCFIENTDHILSGGAPGIDRLAIDWARRMGIEFTIMKAEWNEHGLAAGPIRNQAMLEAADALIAVWDEASRGTYDMVRRWLEQRGPQTCEIFAPMLCGGARRVDPSRIYPFLNR